VYEKKTDELLAELVQTKCGPVVVFGDTEHGGGSIHIDGVRGSRRDIAPFTGDPSQHFIMRTKTVLHC
jgi:hypothetical protein